MFIFITNTSITHSPAPLPVIFSAFYAEVEQGWSRCRAAAKSHAGEHSGALAAAAEVGVVSVAFPPWLEEEIDKAGMTEHTGVAADGLDDPSKSQMRKPAGETIWSETAAGTVLSQSPWC